MIKLLVLLKRHQEVSNHAFQDFRTTEVAARLIGWDACRRYVQYDNHADSPQLTFPPPLELSVDAIDEIWLEGEADERSAVAAQLWKRLEPSRLQAFVGEMKACHIEEREVKRAGLRDGDPGHGLLKRLVPLARKAGTTHEQFMGHWETVHAALLMAVKPGPLRYCQLRVLSELEPPAGIARMTADIDGFSESWFSNEREMNAGRDTPDGMALAADNAVYVERSRRIFFDEREVIHRVPR